MVDIKSHPLFLDISNRQLKVRILGCQRVHSFQWDIVRRLEIIHSSILQRGIPTIVQVPKYLQSVENLKY